MILKFRATYFIHVIQQESCEATDHQPACDDFECFTGFFQNDIWEDMISSMLQNTIETKRQ